MANHPFVVVLGVLAAVATVVGVALQIVGGESESAGRQTDVEGTLTIPDLDSLEPCPEPRLTVSPGLGSVGTRVTLTGRGFDPDTEVRFVYFNHELAPAKTDADGTFTVKRAIPDMFAGGGPPQVMIRAATDVSCRADAPFNMQY